jgi:hypothetical protein
MLWTLDDLNNQVYVKANKALYLLREKARMDILAHGETTVDKEADLVYDLIKAVEWATANTAIPQEDEGYQNLVSYLRHKVEGYYFLSKSLFAGDGSSAGDDGVYGEVTAPPTGTPTVIFGGAMRLFIQMVVGVTAGAPADGAISYTNAGLVGKNPADVEVELDGIRLATGLVDRQSYTFNPLTGAVTFTTPVAYNQVIRIYATTVIP